MEFGLALQLHLLYFLLSQNRVLLDHVVENFRHLINQEGEGPGEEVHIIRQVERLVNFLILFDIHAFILNQDDGTLILV